MSTELLPVNDKTSLTRFWGGKERGVSVQVTQGSNGFVQLTREDAETLGQLLLAFAKEPMDPDLEPMEEWEADQEAAKAKAELVEELWRCDDLHDLKNFIEEKLL